MYTNDRPANDRRPWTRDELILALDLYCRIPFQRTKASNPVVKRLANWLQRTPASVARKLGNFGAFDPQLKKLNISGLTHVGHLDGEIWNEFENDWAALVTAANKLRTIFRSVPKETEVIYPPTGPSEQVRQTKQRLHQAFFRDAVISSYNETCCITGLTIPECLIASHIIPWSKNSALRADPTNGICLSATWDRLFDQGLITISEGLKVIVSKSLMRSTNPAIRREVIERQGTLIIPPSRFFPNPAYLQWHRDNAFR